MKTMSAFALAFFLCVVTTDAYNVPNCNDIASCTGCTDDVECFCEQTKTIVRFPCKLNDRGIRILEEYDLKTNLRCPVKQKSQPITLESYNTFFGNRNFCSLKGEKLPHCLCYKNKVDLASSMSCPMKIAPVKKEEPRLAVAPDLGAVPQLLPVVICFNVSAPDTPRYAGGSDVFTSCSLVLNAILFAVIVILLFFFHYKMKMLKQSASKGSTQQVELNADYEVPLHLLKVPEQVDSGEQPEFIMYEEAQIYLQENATSAVYQTSIPIKTQSLMDTAYGSDTYGTSEREDTAFDSARVDEVKYYSYEQ